MTHFTCSKDGNPEQITQSLHKKISKIMEKTGANVTQDLS